MTGPIGSTRNAGCPEIEMLASFVDGRLEGEARAKVIEHLADCEACREIVAETVRLKDELGEAAGAPVERLAEVVSLPRREGRPKWLLVAAAALVAALGAGLWLMLMRSDNTGATLTALADRPAARSALDDRWTEPRWSVTRGEGPFVSARARAFRLGARDASLRVALGLGDRLGARRLAAESALLLSDVPLADPVAHVYRSIALALGAEGADPHAQLESAETGARLAREAVDPDLWELGRWAEACRLVAVTGAGVGLPRLPHAGATTPAELVPFVDAIEHRLENGVRAHDLTGAIERLLAAGGDLR